MVAPVADCQQQQQLHQALKAVCGLFDLVEIQNPVFEKLIALGRLIFRIELNAGSFKSFNHQSAMIVPGERMSLAGVNQRKRGFIAGIFALVDAVKADESVDDF